MSRLRRVVTGVLAATGALWLVVTAVPVTRWWAQALAGPWPDAAGDILIVFGAEDPASGLPGRTTYWRAFYTILAWRSGRFHTVVVSGASGVAESMRDYLTSQGVPQERILLENASHSTRENATSVARLLAGRKGSTVLLTSDLHMFRAIRTLRRAGVNASPRPIPDAIKRSGSWEQRSSVFAELVTETAKIVGYRVRGWM